MPRIAFFFGISIYMYFICLVLEKLNIPFCRNNFVKKCFHESLGDHGNSHCHAVYGDYAASFDIENGSVLAGQMPPKQEKKIREWILLNKEELNDKWRELSE